MMGLSWLSPTSNQLSTNLLSSLVSALLLTLWLFGIPSQIMCVQSLNKLIQKEAKRPIPSQQHINLSCLYLVIVLWCWHSILCMIYWSPYLIGAPRVCVKQRLSAINVYLQLELECGNIVSEQVSKQDAQTENEPWVEQTIHFGVPTCL